MARKRNNAKGNFAILANIILQDTRLSYKARGLFSFMWSKPPKWTFTEDSLANASDKDGRDSVRSAIKELINFGYLYRYQEKTSVDGKFTSNTVYELYEDPKDNPYFNINMPDVGKSNNGADIGLPDVGLPDIGKSNSNIITDTDKTQNRDILLLQEEISKIYDSYIILHNKPIIEYLKKEKELIVKRIIFNLNKSIKNKKNYVTTSIENEIRKYYAIEKFNKYKNSNFPKDSSKEFTEAEKSIARIDWNTELEK